MKLYLPFNGFNFEIPEPLDDDLYFWRIVKRDHRVVKFLISIGFEATDLYPQKIVNTFEGDITTYRFILRKDKFPEMVDQLKQWSVE